MGENPSIFDHVFLRGYCFLPQLEPQECAATMAALLGKQYSYGYDSTVDRLRPTEVLTPQRLTYSAVFGFNEFPFHTDLAYAASPPRYLMLRCIKGGAGVSTRVVDTCPAINSIGRTNAVRTLMLPRHRLPGQSRLRRLCTVENDAWFVRWDTLFFKPANKFAESMSAEFAEQLRSEKSAEIMLYEKGDTLIIDNWRMVHGRSSVPSDARDRIIDRCFLSELS